MRCLLAPLRDHCLEEPGPKKDQTNKQKTDKLDLMVVKEKDKKRKSEVPR